MEVIEQNETLYSRVQELETRIVEVTQESEAKDRTILELATALDAQTNGQISDAINKLDDI